MEPGQSRRSVIFLIILCRIPHCRRHHSSRSVLSTLVRVVFTGCILLVKPEMYPLIVKTGSNVHAALRSRLAFSERSLNGPSKFIYDAIILRYVGIVKEISQVKTYGLRHIVAVAKRYLLLRYGNLSACSRLILHHIGNCALTRLHLHAYVIYRIDSHGVSIGSISLRVEIGYILSPISQMDDILHISTQHFSRLVVDQFHLHISHHHHIGRKIVSILEHSHVPTDFLTIQRIRDSTFLVKPRSKLLRATSVLVTGQCLFRRLASLHHIE